MRRSVQILVAAVVLFVSVSPVMAGIEFKDGMTHDIDYPINDDVWVDYQSPGLKTTLNILDGALVAGYVIGREDSIINILGGSMNYVRAYGSSQVTVSGGSMSGLQAFNSNQVTVSGGSIGQFVASGSSQVTVSGGSMSGKLCADVEGILTIHGSDFAVDGMLVGYTELTSIFGGDFINEPYRQLTGTLLSGDPINNQFQIGDNASIVLVPEPATLLLLGLGGLALLRNRRFR